MDSSSLDSESVGKKESWEEADRRFKALLQQGTLTPHEKQMLDEAVGSATTYGAIGGVLAGLVPPLSWSGFKQLPAMKRMGLSLLVSSVGLWAGAYLGLVFKVKDFVQDEESPLAEAYRSVLAAQKRETGKVPFFFRTIPEEKWLKQTSRSSFPNDSELGAEPQEHKKFSSTSSWDRVRQQQQPQTQPTSKRSISFQDDDQEEHQEENKAKGQHAWEAVRIKTQGHDRLKQRSWAEQDEQEDRDAPVDLSTQKKSAWRVRNAASEQIDASASGVARNKYGDIIE